VTEQAHSGEHSALLGITDPGEDAFSFSSIWQDLFVPPDAQSVTFSYWYYPVSLDPEDRQIVEVREPNNENRNRLRGFAGDTSNEQKWLFGSFDLAEHYPGKTIRLYFSAFEPQSGRQSWQRHRHVRGRRVAGGVPAPRLAQPSPPVPHPALTRTERTCIVWR